MIAAFIVFMHVLSTLRHALKHVAASVYAQKCSYVADLCLKRHPAVYLLLSSLFKNTHQREH